MATTIWYSNPTSGNAMDWTDTNQWNTATDGSGTAGNPDSTDDKAIIQSGDTVTLDTNVTTGQVSVLGTLTGNTSYSLTLAGSDEDNNYNNAGTVTNLNLIMTGIRASGDRTIVDAGSGIRDFTLNDTTNSGNNVHKLGGNLSISGDLTITSGTLDTLFLGTDRSLTVAGQTIVGPNSGAADQATLTCNASTCSFGAAVTSGYALDVKRGGTFNGGSGTHTSGAVKVTTDSNAEAKLDFTSGTHVISSEYTSEDRFFELTSGTVTHSNGTILLNAALTSAIQWLGTAGDAGPYNLTLSHASNTTKPRNALTVLNDLKITSGTFNTQYDGSDKNLTVTRDVIIGESSGSGDNAVLTGNASEIIIHGGMKIDVTGKYDATTHANGTVINKYLAGGGLFALQLIAGGTFIHNDGLVHVTGTGGYSIVIEGLSGSDVSGTDANALHDLKVTLNSISNFVKLDPVPSSNGDTMVITGDLDIVEGKAYGNSTSDNLTVNGAVTVRDGAQLSESTSTSGAMTFGSLTIESGGTYIATSGTTTISTGTIDNDGTLTHNKGTIKIDHDTGITLDLTGSDASVIPVYNLIVDTDNTVGYAACTIGNNLTKKGSGRMRPTGDSGRTIEVMGTLLIEAGTFGRGASDTHTNTFGNVVLTGGTIDLTGGGGSGKTIVKGAFRNVGGTVNTP